MSSVDRDRAIIRFMSFSKFMDMLTFSRSFFPSVANLREQDPLEGMLPAQNAIVESGMAAALDHLVNYSAARALGTDAESERLRAEPARLFPVKMFESPFGPIRLTHGRSLSSVLDQVARIIDVQCWHASEVESVAMWRIYGGSEPSIAIRSTVGNLMDALHPDPGESVYIGSVEYIDHDTAICGVEHVLAPFLRKSLPYEYEREVRAIVYDSSDDIDRVRETSGRHVQIDLAMLVEGVFVSPAAPDWFLELTQAIVLERINRPVMRSAIGKVPFFQG